jgi:hypothetical protein
MPSVKGIRVPHLGGKVRELPNGEHALHIMDPWTPRGAFAWRLEDTGARFLQFVCPCGCGIIHSARVRRGDHPMPDPALGPVWTWNESEAEPSLTPSLHMVQTCGWHGYLTLGVFVSV